MPEESKRRPLPFKEFGKCIALMALLAALLGFGGEGCSNEAGSNPLHPAADAPGDTFVTPTIPSSPPETTPVAPSDSPSIPKSIQWIRDWAEALRTAEVENKPIMVNFYTDVCPACKKLDQYTFTDAAVIALVNERFIPVKSNAGKSSLYQEYGIGGVPTTVFTRPNGEEIGRIIGYYPAEIFRQGMEEAWNLWVGIHE